MTFDSDCHQCFPFPFRITRIEVSHQERSDALRADMRELARRVQNLDWLTTKTENTLDQMRNEVEGIRMTIDDSGSNFPQNFLFHTF